VLLLTFALFLARPFVSPAQEVSAQVEMPDFPKGQGVFCRLEASKWAALAPATIVDTELEGMKRFLETVGQSAIYTTITYSGEKAKVQIPDVRPVFFIRGVALAQNALIVRLTQKKDSRETYTESDNTTYDNRGGYKTSEIRRLIITSYSKDAFAATPEEPLKSGEYLLTFGNTHVGYDFSIVVLEE